MNSRSNNWKLFFLITLGIAIIPVLTYWWNLGTGNLSDDFKDWVDFSTYWSPFLVVALTIILAYISWQSLELMKLKEKPILATEKDDFFLIKNIGSGPAINMKIFFSIDSYDIPDTGNSLVWDKFLSKSGITGALGEIAERGEFHYMVRSVNLCTQESLTINWQNSIRKLVIVYNDIYNKSYSLVIENNENQMFESDIVGIDHLGFKNGKKILYSKTKDNANYGQIFTISEIRNMNISL